MYPTLGYAVPICGYTATANNFAVIFDNVKMSVFRALFNMLIIRFFKNSTLLARYSALYLHSVPVVKFPMGTTVNARAVFSPVRYGEHRSDRKGD